jgi:hypothetical protein
MKVMKRGPLEEIPGVGPNLARHLQDLGYRTVDSLRGQNAEEMYDRLISLCGGPVDRCVLYVFRCAVYYAEGGREPRKLKWWNWKDSLGSAGSRKTQPPLVQPEPHRSQIASDARAG